LSASAATAALVTNAIEHRFGKARLEEVISFMLPAHTTNTL
jgi:hypothetical protein